MPYLYKIFLFSAALEIKQSPENSRVLWSTVKRREMGDATTCWSIVAQQLCTETSALDRLCIKTAEVAQIESARTSMASGCCNAIAGFSGDDGLLNGAPNGLIECFYFKWRE